MNFLKNITFADIKISRASKIGVPTSLRTPGVITFQEIGFFLHITSISIILNSILVNELKKYIDADSLTEDSSQPNSLDVSFDGKPKIKSPRDPTKPRKKSSPLRKLSNESQKLP